MTERQEWKRDHFHEIYGRSKESVERELQEGQGSQLLRELAKIELQAAVGNQLVGLVKDRIASYALDSPGNLRLIRTLLTDRSVDEVGFQVTVGEDVEDWVVEGADDATAIIDLWNLLLDAEQATIMGGSEQSQVGEKNIGRAAAVTELQRVFTELEIIVGSYQVVHRVEGRSGMVEEIAPYPTPPKED